MSQKKKFSQTNFQCAVTSGTLNESHKSSNLLQMLHEGLSLADRVGHLLHYLGHLSWGQQKLGDLHRGIGDQGCFRRRLQDGD